MKGIDIPDGCWNCEHLLFNRGPLDIDSCKVDGHMIWDIAYKCEDWKEWQKEKHEVF